MSTSHFNFPILMTLTQWVLFWPEENNALKRWKSKTKRNSNSYDGSQRPFSNNLKLDEMKHISNFHEKCRTEWTREKYSVSEKRRKHTLVRTGRHRFGQTIYIQFGGVYFIYIYRWIDRYIYRPYKHSHDAGVRNLILVCSFLVFISQVFGCTRYRLCRSAHLTDTPWLQ